jgi:hypothetical protein
MVIKKILHAQVWYPAEATIRGIYNFYTHTIRKEERLKESML